MSILTMEASLKAMEQFNTDEERAALFLDMTSNLFETYRQLSSTQEELERVRELLEESKQTIKDTINWINEQSLYSSVYEIDEDDMYVEKFKLEEFLQKIEAPHG
ncbi:MAG: hypothetical protein AB7I27_00565 [Bacteriovoracaceae bacterium]